MLGAIRQLSGARIGRPKKWDKIARKVRADEPLSAAEAEYYARLTRIYSRPATAAPRKSYHTALSGADQRPRCAACSCPSDFYCHMNDQYLCSVHVVGHDPNE